MCVTAGICTFKALLRKLMFTFRERLHGSTNCKILTDRCDSELFPLLIQSEEALLEVIVYLLISFKSLCILCILWFYICTNISYIFY